MRDVFNRLYRTKMILSCLVLVASGIILMVVAPRIGHADGLSLTSSRVQIEHP